MQQKAYLKEGHLVDEWPCSLKHVIDPLRPTAPSCKFHSAAGARARSLPAVSRLSSIHEGVLVPVENDIEPFQDSAAVWVELRVKAMEEKLREIAGLSNNARNRLLPKKRKRLEKLLKGLGDVCQARPKIVWTLAAYEDLDKFLQKRRTEVYHNILKPRPNAANPRTLGTSAQLVGRLEKILYGSRVPLGLDAAEKFDQENRKQAYIACQAMLLSDLEEPIVKIIELAMAALADGTGTKWDLEAANRLERSLKGIVPT